MDNNLVKSKQVRYTNGKAHGRLKRKSAVAQAERRTNDIVSNRITLYRIHIILFTSHLSTYMMVKMKIFYLWLVK